MEGMALTREISREYLELPIMVITAFGDGYAEGTVISDRAREFLRKLFTLDEFAVRLNNMINDTETVKRTKKEENVYENFQDLKKELEKILNNS